MKFYYQDSLSASYSISSIDTIKFENDMNQNKLIGVYVLGLPKSYLISEIDSITFREVDTVKIGNQVWKTKNLDVSYYRNGDLIPQVTNASEWAGLSTGAWCYYYNDPNNNYTYCKLYNWYAVNDPRGLAPTGWHVASDIEWKTLEMNLGMTQSEVDKNGWRGTSEGGKLKEIGYTHWFSPNTGATNSSDFIALPGGIRNTVGSFSNIGYDGMWWTSTGLNESTAMFRKLNCLTSLVERNNIYKSCGFSVRCLKD